MERRGSGRQAPSSRSRRLLVLPWVLAGLAVLLAGCYLVYERVGGDFRGPPSELAAGLSPGARQLVAEVLEGLDRRRLADFHVHLVGVGTGGSGIWLNPRWSSLWHPLLRARKAVYMSAAGVRGGASADRDYVLRLVDLARWGAGGRYHLLAMDRRYRPDGTADPERTSFYVPNDYAWRVAQEFSDCFVPVISVHPYRRDALEELERWARRGCRYVKWLPNAMGIDPSEERLEPFYSRMVELGMILLTHTGLELAVEAADQELGNPLRLRRPLDMGLRVVALHAGSLGESEDLDHPDRGKVPSFRLLLRLLEEPRYEGRLFGEIAGFTFYNHLGEPLRTLLERPELQRRFVNGSDYPLPGINALVRTGRLVREGFISEEERGYLNEIYAYNPLLFDLAVKRTVRHPQTGERLAAGVFMVPRELEE